MVTQPLIVAKVGLQSKPPSARQGKPFQSFVEVMKYIVEHEGLLALFKGIAPQITKGVIVQGLLMMTKERCILHAGAKSFALADFPQDGSPVHHPLRPSTQDSRREAGKGGRGRGGYRQKDAADERKDSNACDDEMMYDGKGSDPRCSRILLSPFLHALLLHESGEECLVIEGTSLSAFLIIILQQPCMGRQRSCTHICLGASEGKGGWMGRCRKGRIPDAWPTKWTAQ